MFTTITSRLDETPEQPDSAGVARSEPGGERSDALAGANMRVCRCGRDYRGLS